MQIKSVLLLWDRLRPFRSALSEGVCLAVLDVAARRGHAALATRVIKLLRERGIVPLEHHLSAVIEAIARGGNLVGAADRVGKMRAGGVVPTEATSAPFVRELRRGVAADPSGADEHGWLRLEPPARLRRFINELASGPPVDPSVFNALIQAALEIRPFDLTRAVEIYSMRTELRTKADGRTFHLMLRGALEARDTALGTRLIADMRKLAIAPTPLTYQHAIELALVDPGAAGGRGWSQRSAIANALQYLREMRASDLTPTPRAWEALAIVLAEQRHALLHTVVEDMRAAGVPVSRSLRHAMSPDDRALLLGPAAEGTSRRSNAQHHF